MKIKSTILFLTCLLLLSSFTTPATACCEGDPPGECYVCEDTVWVQDGDCWGGCPECESCVSCYCECTSECCTDLDCEYGGEGCESCVDCICEDDDSKCTGECHNGCSGGSCVDDDSKCSTIIFCEECNNGTCQDRCPALGKYCNGGGDCVDCTRNEHCNDICLHCFGGECINNCTYCYSPRYCTGGCFCVECSTEEDHDACSESKEEDYACSCTSSIFMPCSDDSMRDYTGNLKITCTSSTSSCEPQEDPLCYTKYDCDSTWAWSGYMCKTGDLPAAGKACRVEYTIPAVCWPCKRDSGDPGNEFYTEQTTCPEEQWY